MALDLSTLRRPANPQVVDPSTGRMREDWQLYFDQLTTRINASVGALATDPAPADAQYIVAATNSTLSAERVATDTATIEWDFATAGQAKANFIDPGFVVGPASSTDNAIARFDGTGGKTLQNSLATIGDDGNFSFVGPNGTFLSTAAGTNTVLEIGRVDGTSSLTALDFHTGATAVDYDTRILASGGSGVAGGGTLNLVGASVQANSSEIITAATLTHSVTPIAQGAISAAATVDLALGSADMYEIDLMNIVPATDNVSFYCRLSQSGSFLSGANNYQYSHQINGAASVSGGATQMIVTTSVGNNTNERLNFTLRIFRPSAGSFIKQLHWLGGGRLQNGTVFNIQGFGELIANSSAVDGIQFLMSSGNISSGYYAQRAYSFT